MQCAHSKTLAGRILLRFRCAFTDSKELKTRTLALWRPPEGRECRAEGQADPNMIAEVAGRVGDNKRELWPLADSSPSKGRAGEEGHGSGGFSIVVQYAHVRVPRPAQAGRPSYAGGSRSGWACPAHACRLRSRWASGTTRQSTAQSDDPRRTVLHFSAAVRIEENWGVFERAEGR